MNEIRSPCCSKQEKQNKKAWRLSKFRSLNLPWNGFAFEKILDTDKSLLIGPFLSKFCRFEVGLGVPPAGPFFNRLRHAKSRRSTRAWHTIWEPNTACHGRLKFQRCCQFICRPRIDRIRLEGLYRLKITCFEATSQVLSSSP